MTYIFWFKILEGFFFQMTNILSNCFVHFSHRHWSMNGTEVGISCWLVCDSVECYCIPITQTPRKHSCVQEGFQSFLTISVHSNWIQFSCMLAVRVEPKLRFNNFKIMGLSKYIFIFIKYFKLFFLVRCNIIKILRINLYAHLVKIREPKNDVR